MTRLLPISGFELRQQLCSHVFWIVTAISAIMVTSAVLVPQLRVGLGRIGLLNGAETVVRVHLVWSLFFMFASTAFVADAVLRDVASGFAPIMRAAPITRFDYLAGRFVGAFAAVLLCFLEVIALNAR